MMLVLLNSGFRRYSQQRRPFDWEAGIARPPQAERLKPAHERSRVVGNVESRREQTRRKHPQKAPLGLSLIHI